MNREGHFWTSIFSCLGLFLIMYKLDSKEFLIYSLPAYATTFIPDLLDTPGNWNHRAYFHSKRFFKLLIVFLVIFLVLAVIKSKVYFFGVFGVAGTILHLIVDSLSWKGLRN